MPQTPWISQRAQRALGQPISHLMHAALARPNLISLAAGFVDLATLPVDEARQAIESVLGDQGTAREALQYGTTQGNLRLREIVAAGLAISDGQQSNPGYASADQVIITAGSNQLLHLLTDTLCDPGDIVLCASPTYFVYLGILQNVGVRAVGIDCDEQGMLPDALDQVLSKLSSEGSLPRVKAIYVVSYFDNPSGITTSASRRSAIVELARRWSRTGAIHVLDDSAYRELRYAGDDVPSMRAFDPDGRTVIVTNTLSKSFSPGLRVGWGVLPSDLIPHVLHQKGNIDFGSSNLCQHAAAAVFERGLFEPHVARLRQRYREKLAAMIDATHEWLDPISGVSWLPPAGGLYLWIRLPDEIDAGPAGPLFSRAVEEGVLYVPGEFCFPPGESPPTKNMIRLSFGVQTPERIAVGIAALSRAVRAVLNDPVTPVHAGSGR